VLVAVDAPLLAYLAAFALVSLGYGVMSRVMLRRGGMLASFQAPEPELEQSVRRHLFWTVLLVLAYTLSNKSIETYLLNATVGPAEVGFFAIAAALSRGGVDLLSSGLMTVMMPIMAHAFGEGGPDRVNAIMSNSLRYCFFLGLLLVGVGLLLSRPGVTLMYGDKYSEVVMPLRVMVLVGGLTLGESAFNALLSTTDNQRMRVVFSCASLAIAVAFAFALVPTYGLLGAVASYACSRLLVFALLAVGISRMMRLRLPVREFLRLAGCALLAGGVSFGLVLLAPGLWTEIVAGIVFALVFVFGTVFFNAWRASDVGHLLEYLERYPLVHGRLSGFLERWALRLR
jgi:O-antigen/teichoic acid export membrane protein